MIIFRTNGSHIEVISTEYGSTGQAELRAFFKKSSAKRDIFKNEGSPHMEVLIFPSTKIQFVSNHAKQVDGQEYLDTLSQKTNKYKNNSNATKPVQRPTYSTEEEDEPIRHNRRSEFDRKNSKQENIRQSRRNNNKRNFPSGKEDDDNE